MTARSSKPAKAKATQAKKAKTAPKRSTTQATSQTKNPTSKNVSKRYPNGRTLTTEDKYLPISKRGKSTDPKEERWVAIIDSNKKDELAVVRLTKQNQPNQRIYLPIKRETVRKPISSILLKRWIEKGIRLKWTASNLRKILAGMI